MKLPEKLFNLNSPRYIISLFFILILNNSLVAQKTLNKEFEFSFNSLKSINDTLFFATEKGIYYLDDNKLELYYSSYYFDRIGLFFENEYFDLFEYKNSLYYITADSIISPYANKELFIESDNHKFLKKACVAGDYIFVALSEKEVFKLTVNNSGNLIVLDTFLLDNRDINNMYCDKDNTVWIATYSGLYSIKNSIMTKITQINEPVYCIAEKNDVLYFGGNGVLWKKQQDDVFFEEIPLCISNKIKYLDFGGDDQLWFVAEEIAGIICDGNKQKYCYLRDIYKNVKSIYGNSIKFTPNSGVAYITTDGKGVFSITADDLKIVDTCTEILPCQEEQTAGEGSGYPKTHIVSESGRFRVFWDMFDYADRLIVYEGRVPREENIIFDTDYVKNKGKSKMLNTTEKYITIRIIGNDSYNETKWNYHIKCMEK